MEQIINEIINVEIIGRIMSWIQERAGMALIIIIIATNIIMVTSACMYMSAIIIIFYIPLLA